MNSSLRFKLSFIIFLVVFSVFALVPSLTDGIPDWWKKYLSPNGLRLGLDLQGGLHVVLKVNLEEAEKISLSMASEDLRNFLGEKQINAVLMTSANPKKIVFTLPNASSLPAVETILKENFSSLDAQIDTQTGSFPRIMLALKQSEVDYIRQNAVDQSLEIIRNRIDQFGVSEPIVLRQGEDQIVVQLPGVQDPERALELIGRTAQLQFKLVAETPGLNLQQMVDDLAQSGRWDEKKNDRAHLNALLQSRLPQGTEIYFEKKIINPDTKQEAKIPILIESPILMTGAMIKNAQPRTGGTFNEVVVSLTMTGHGTEVFARITEKHLGRQLAIILDENVRSAPVLKAKILTGQAEISGGGGFAWNEASDLAIVLRVGSLPAPVDVVQNLTVGASLGKDSIRDGLVAGVIGSGMVIIFMVVYYGLSGVIANIALALNILLLFVGLAMFGATLTLPGIAGIILTIGMAVDANILIYERMRDEFALGKSLRLGVETGFNKAFSSIVDSQVTTLITALILFMFGTGPIKGFAITLSLGIIFNLFAVLFGSRLIYDILLTKRRLAKPKFLSLIGKTTIDFMGIRKYAYACSIVFLLLGFIAFIQIARGHANMGVDFSGGILLQYKADKPFALADIRADLNEGDLGRVDLQEVTGANRLIVKIKRDEEKFEEQSDQITAILVKSQPDCKFQLESKSEISASVSSDLRSKAVVAVLFSLVGILLYLAFRFDFRFAIAAAITTFHDIIAVLGICWLMGKEINLLIITALLTLGGFSLNDTVVIFDRIRENMNKNEGLNMYQTINNSINQVLARSIITGLTLLFTLVALFFFGGAILRDFAFVLLVGLIIGVFSSVFVASPLLTVNWGRKKQSEVLPRYA